MKKSIKTIEDFKENKINKLVVIKGGNDSRDIDIDNATHDNRWPND